MASNPDIQSTAQAEIDSVIPDHRLVCVSDIESLPYLAATIKETLRWRPALPLGTCRFSLVFVHLFMRVPLGIARLSRQDDMYRGMKSLR
jgi:cytochrome P450